MNSLNYAKSTPGVAELTKIQPPRFEAPAVPKPIKFDFAQNAAKVGGKGLVDSLGGAAGVTSLATGAVGMLAGAIKSDKTSVRGDGTISGEVNKKKAALSGGLSMGAEWASKAAVTGNPFVMAGAAIAGGVIGAIKGKKQAESQNIANAAHNEGVYAGKRATNRATNSSEFSNLTRFAKDGMKFSFDKKLNLTNSKFLVPNNKSINTPVFKRGGVLSSQLKNIIPNGARHEEENGLIKGDKGQPVVQCDLTKKETPCAKIAEIEREELILHLEATKKIEELAKRYKETQEESILEELGDFLQHEIKNNTYSYA